MLQQVKAQNYINYDLISISKSMTFYLSCHFPSGLMSLCSTVDAFQPPQGPIMNSQKSSCNSLGSKKIVGLWLDVCVIRCPFFRPILVISVVHFYRFYSRHTSENLLSIPPFCFAGIHSQNAKLKLRVLK
jgi:hypothetical protein